MNLAYSGDDAFNALLYGDKNPDTVSYFRERISQIPDTITEYGRAFMERTRTAFEHYNGASAVRFARSILAKVQHVSKPDVVQSLRTVEQLREAGSVMQRWMMANPVINQKYIRQQLDGYSETYASTHGSSIGHDNYDYRRVKQGWVEMDVEEDGAWKAVEYLDDLRPGDGELDILQQSDIHDSWRWGEYLLALGKDDFTDKTGGQL